jgi:acyl-CoA reductase-like NAD-dependent aldehyde dehydrogenase
MGNRVMDYINPATGQKFGQIEMSDPEAVHQVVQEMRTSFNIWSSKTIRERISVLRKFQKEIIDSTDEITSVINQDSGKNRQDALIEVFITVDMLHQYLKRAPGWLKPRRVSRGLTIFKRTYVEPRPYGVVGVIVPWNYPFALAMPPVLSALIAGNTVVMKPSEVTPATGEMMERLFERVPELAPFVRVVHGDGTVGEALVRSNPDYIFLTGSPETGRKVLRNASEHLIPVSAELGGKDAMLVLDDADLRAAARWGVWGALFNSGQTCISVERVYVESGVYDQFIQLVLEEIDGVKVGYTQEVESPYAYGPITDSRQVKILKRHLEDAMHKGARMISGGDIQGEFISPIVLLDVNHDMLVMRDESFGPIMPIMRVKDALEAINMANDSSFGLGASVWSNDLERAEWVASKLQAGSVIVNDTIAQFGVPMLPFGGIKQSGFGRIHGKYGLMQFTRTYSHAVGYPPPELDLATKLREPGNYRFGSAMLRLLRGVTLRQRVQPLTEALWRRAKKADRRKVTTATGLLGAAIAITVVVNKLKK